MIDYAPADQALRPLERQVHDWLFSQHVLEFPMTAIYLGTAGAGPAPSMDGNAVW